MTGMLEAIFFDMRRWTTTATKDSEQFWFSILFGGFDEPENARFEP